MRVNWRDLGSRLERDRCWRPGAGLVAAASAHQQSQCSGGAGNKIQLGATRHLPGKCDGAAPASRADRDIWMRTIAILPTLPTLRCTITIREI